jgi:hypothetical protein
MKMCSAAISSTQHSKKTKEKQNTQIVQHFSWLGLIFVQYHQTKYQQGCTLSVLYASLTKRPQAMHLLKDNLEIVIQSARTLAE